MALSNFRMYYTRNNIKNSYRNNKFKIPGTIWDEKFELSDESYSVSDVQNNFKYMIKKH